MTFPLPPITALLSAAIAVFLAATAGSNEHVSAQTDPVVSVDAISDAANTATAVGTVDPCFSTTAGATFDVDIVVQSVSNISGFQADLFYDPSVLEVTAVDYNFLLASAGAAVLDLGNSTPDTDGDFFMAAAMFSPIIVIGADGDGVLARVTFEAVGSGSSPLDLANVKLSDADGNPIPPTDADNFYSGPVNDASVAVDSSCGEVDSDADGFTDTEEAFMGTDPVDACPDHLDDDAWPADMAAAEGYGKHDAICNILDVVQLTPPVFGTSPPDPDYSTRKDFNGDGTINILDIVRLTPPVFNTSCTP